MIGKVIALDGEAAVVTIAESGIVEGELRAPAVVIDGTLAGDAHGENIELQKHARVQGNVHYQVIEMAAGAALTGRLIHTGSLTVAQVTGDNVVELAATA